MSLVNFIHYTTLEDLGDDTNNRIEWAKFVDGIIKHSKSTLKRFQPDDEVIVVNLIFINELTKILDETDPDVLRNVLAWYAAKEYGLLTTKAFRELNDNFTYAYTKLHDYKPHSAICFDLLNRQLPYALTRVYIEQHFTSNDIDYVLLN